MHTQPPTAASKPGQAGRTPLTFVALVAGGMLAAGVGGYVAQSPRQTELPVAEAKGAQSRPAPPAATPVATTPPAPATSTAEPAVSQPAPAETVEIEAAPLPKPAAGRPAPEPVERPAPPVRRVERPRPAAERASAQAPPAPSAPPPSRTADPAPAVDAVAADARPVEDAPAPAPVQSEPAARPQSARVTMRESVTIPADSVMGLEITETVSSESAQVEDRVDARVTRDVRLDGTLVIPAGAKVIGNVIRVENGGRFKERARLGIRFHTLVLADGESVDVETDPIFREGENVSRKASTRIGASAAGGAIIGAIFGGEKGAAIGAAAGAGAGTAVTAAQKPSEARFRAGSVVTVRLTAPVDITLEQ